MEAKKTIQEQDEEARRRRAHRERPWRSPLKWKGRWWNVLSNIEWLVIWLLGYGAWLLWGRMNTPVRMEDVVPYMCNGDLLLFSGLGVPQTLGTKVWTRTDKTHTGVVIIMNGEPCVLESSVPTDKVVDVLTHIQGKDGVRIVPVREKINEYYESDSAGPITYIPLLTERGRRPQFAAKNWGGVGEAWIMKEHKKTFNGNVFSLVGADEHVFHARLFRDISCPAAAEHERFCSELVAAYLRRLGVLEKTRKPAKYTPGDFYHADHLALSYPFAYKHRYDIY